MQANEKECSKQMQQLNVHKNVRNVWRTTLSSANWPVRPEVARIRPEKAKNCCCCWMHCNITNSHWLSCGFDSNKQLDDWLRDNASGKIKVPIQSYATQHVMTKCCWFNNIAGRSQTKSTGLVPILHSRLSRHSWLDTRALLVTWVSREK